MFGGNEGKSMVKVYEERKESKKRKKKKGQDGSQPVSVNVNLRC